MKIAIVTGASSGMGREAVIQLADRFGGGLGEIWAVARRADRLEELRSQVPVPLRILPLDLQKPDALEQLGWQLKQQKPDVKILVNAAGYGKTGTVGSIAGEEETGMVRLNCEALCGVTSAVLPYMSRESRIIQFASAAAFLPQPGFAVYAATKAFVLSYSQALNSELKPRGITVTAVCPGPVATEFFQVASPSGDASAVQTPFYGKAGKGCEAGCQRQYDGENDFRLWASHEGIFPALSPGSPPFPSWSDGGVEHPFCEPGEE